MADFRALCAELVELSAPTDSLTQLAERLQNLAELACRARAALAQPEPQGPSDQELDEMFTEVDQGGECQSWRAFARAVLARWGRPAIEPQADGEVAELVAWLRYNADYALQKAATATFKRFHRAADLLERLAQSEPQGPSRPAIEPVP